MSLSTASIGAAIITRVCGALNEAVARCTATVWPACQAAMMGCATEALLLSMMKGPAL